LSWNKELLVSQMTEIFRQIDENRVDEEHALAGCAGLELFENPVFGFASADDPLFLKYKEPAIVGEPYMTPQEWMPEAKTVISFFVPFTARVRSANYGDPEHVANEWLHGRIEGQACITAFTKRLQLWLEEQGIKACVPALDPRFETGRRPLPGEGSEDVHISSAWSERHAAYAAGLGTFSLTRGLISEKGVAGRYGSVIISEEIMPDTRPYTGIDDYCIRCGACVERCPVGAISLEGGKNQRICQEWIRGHTAVAYKPRYGCGKCQVGVPCENRNPSKRTED